MMSSHLFFLFKLFFVLFFVACGGGGGGSTNNPQPNTDKTADVPTGLKALLESGRTITLSWEPVVGATVTYVAYRHDATADVTQGINSGSITTPSHTFSGTINDPKADTTYYLAVQATIDGVKGKLSDPITVKTIKTPTPILRVTAKESAVTLDWTSDVSPDSLVSYKLYYAKKTFPVKAGDPFNATNHKDLTGNVGPIDSFFPGTITGLKPPGTITGLEPETEYFFVLTAHQDDEIEIASDVVSAKPIIPAPINLVGMPGHAQLTLNWAFVAGASVTYVAYASPDITADIINWTEGTSDTPSFTFLNLSNYTTYYLKVRAKVNGVEGKLSDSISVKTRLIPTFIATPGDRMVTINWSPVADFTYDLHRNEKTFETLIPGENFEPTDGIEFKNVVPGQTYNNLKNGKKYYFVLVAQNSTNTDEIASTEVSVTPAVPAPNNLKGTSRVKEVILSWDKVKLSPDQVGSTRSVSYLVYGHTDASADITEWTEGTSDNIARSFSFNKLKDGSALLDGKTYYFKVRAVVAGVEEMLSDPISVATTPIFTAIPGDKKIDLQWTLTDGVSYTLYHSAQSFNITAGSVFIESDYTHDKSISYPSSSPHTVVGLTNGTPHFFVLTAHQKDGTKIASAEVSEVPSLLPPKNFAGISDDKKVTLSWDAVESPGETVTYVIYIKDNLLWKTKTSNTNSFEVTELDNYKQYHFKVKASVKGIEGQSSPIIAVRPTPRITTITGSGEVLLDWNTSFQNVGGAKIMLYSLYRAEQSFKVTPGAEFDEADKLKIYEHIEMSSPLTTPVKISDLTNDIEYFFVLATTYFDGSSILRLASAEVSVTPIARSNSVPTNLKGASSSAGYGRVDLSWDAVTDPVATVTHVAYAHTNKLETDLSKWTRKTSTTNSLYFDGLTLGQPYFFKVGAIFNEVEETTLSAPVRIAPMPDLHAAQADDTKVKLTWEPLNKNDSESRRRVYYSTSSFGLTAGSVFLTTGDASSILMTSNTVNNVWIDGLTNGTTYYFVLTLSDRDGGIQFVSNEISAIPSSR